MTFNYIFPVPDTDPNCVTSFSQSFHHKDWFDGVDVVQAQQTSDEDGFNLRFHRIEQDIANLAKDVGTAVSCIAVLRSQLVEVLTEIKAQFNAPPAKTTKETKDTKESKDTKDVKDGKDTKDIKDVKDGKDTKDIKDVKDGKDAKDTKDVKDVKDGKDGKDGKDDKDGKESGKEGGVEHQIPAPLPQPPMSLSSGLHAFLWTSAPAVEPAAAGHVFIRPHERPMVGERALKGPEDADS